jgi:transcriptional regulator with XRE-family HTH domain
MTNFTPALPYLTLGQAIASGRSAVGLEKQADLAGRLGTSQQSVSRWEAGTHRPRAAQIPVLASLLNLDPQDLMTLAGYATGAYTATRVEPLPVDRLDPETFEQFTTDLLRKLYPEADTRRLGAQGHAQGGLDIETTFPDGRVFGFQCKRVQQFGPGEVRKAAAYVTRPSNKTILVLSRVASPQTADAVREHKNWELWDRDDLSRLVRTELPIEQQVRLVDIYFKGQRRALLGIDEAGPWLTGDEFFIPFEGRDKPFSHAWPLVAREAEMVAIVEFSESADTVLILSAPAGMGKSKLLRDACARLQQVKPGLTVRFLSSANDLDRKGLEHLGLGAKLLVVDDAHDRDKLGELFQYAANPKNLTKIILATRPYATARLRNQAAAFGFVKIGEVALPALKRENLEALATEVLADKAPDSAALKRLVQYAGPSPLVIAMAARVLSTERIPFDSITDQEIFRTVILSRFEKILLGDLGVAGAEKLHRDVLEVLALVQPFHIEDVQLHQMVQQVRGVSPDDTSIVLRRFLEGGVIFKRGHQYRLMPDVLADYVLDRACLDTAGNLSPFARSAIECVPEKLRTNLLVNLGRMDWRRTDGKTEDSLLLSQIWRSFDAIETEYDPRLDAIKSVAIYQPAQSLDFVRRQVMRGRSFRSLPDILKGIAYSGSLFDDVLEVLWALGREETSETNSNTSHPIRVITDIASYDLRKPFYFSEGVLDFALRLCDDPKAWVHRYTPLDLLKPLMSAEGMHTTSDRMTFSFQPFLIDYEQVKTYRARILDKMIALLSNSNVRMAYEAASFIETATRGPIGRAGRVGSRGELDVFYAEFTITLGRVLEVLRAGVHPVAAAQIVQKVVWFTKRHLPELMTVAKAIIKAAPENDVDYIIREVAFGKVWDRFIDDNIDTYQERIDRFMKQRAAKIIKAYPDAQARLSAIEAALADLAEAHVDAQPYLLMHQMCRDDLTFANALCETALSAPNLRIAQFAHIALGLLLELDIEQGRAWARRFVDSKQKAAIHATAAAYRSREDNLSSDDVRLIEGLLKLDDPDLAGNAIYTVATWRTMPAASKLALLVEANFSGRSHSADQAALALCGLGRDGELQNLPVDQVVAFLHKIEDVPALEGHWIDKLLADLSEWFPFETLRFFMARVELQVKHEGMRVANYGPWKHEHLRFTESPAYPELTRVLWQWMAENAESRHFAYAAADFIEAAIGHDNGAVAEFLSGYLDTAGPGELNLMSRLLRQVKPNFVFDQLSFVLRYLEHCRDVGTDTWERATQCLSSAASSGMRSGTPGEPMPRDVSDAGRATEILSRLSKLSPAYDLYDYIRRHAQSNIARSRADAEAWEDD